MRAVIGALVLLLTCGVLHARVTMVVFPIMNRDTVARELSEWTECVPAEVFSRTARYSADLQVYDAAVVFAGDTMFPGLDSDSVLTIHRARWKWDVAVGGSCRRRSDTLSFTLEAVRATGRGFERHSFVAEGVSVLDIMERLAAELLEAAAGEEVREACAPLIKPAGVSEISYRTFAAGYRFELQRRYDAAVSAYLHALDINPSLAWAAVRLAHLYARAGDNSAAVRWANYAARQASNDPIVQAGALAVLAGRISPDKLVSFVSKQETLLHSTADGLAALGRYYMARGEHRRAVAYFTQAVAAGPADLEVTLTLGEAALRAGDFTLAAETFNHLVTFRPECARYYSFLGSAYRSMGRLMESVRVLTYARQLAGDDVTVLVNMANTYVELGWLEEAERLLVRARELDPLVQATYENLATVYWLRGKKEEARKVLAEIPRRKRSQGVTNNEAVMLFEEGRRREALAQLVKAHKSGRRNERILANLGMLCEKNGRLREAALWYDELLKVNPEHVEGLRARSRIAQRRKEFDVAERGYRVLLQRNPHDNEAIAELATVLSEQGRFKDAADVLEKYLNEYPADTETRIRLGRTYLKMGWPQVAAFHFELAVREAPRSYDAQVGLGESLLEVLNRGASADTSALVEALEKARDLAPQESDADYLLGCFYRDHGRNMSRAREHFQRALEHAATRSKRTVISKALARVTP